MVSEDVTADGRLRVQVAADLCTDTDSSGSDSSATGSRTNRKLKTTLVLDTSVAGVGGTAPSWYTNRFMLSVTPSTESLSDDDYLISEDLENSSGSSLKSQPNFNNTTVNNPDDTDLQHMANDLLRWSHRKESDS